MAKESHFLTIGTAHKSEQTNTTSSAGRILDLRTKVMMWIQFYSKTELVKKKTPFLLYFPPYSLLAFI